jgi:hypothetical protein
MVDCAWYTQRNTHTHTHTHMTHQVVDCAWYVRGFCRHGARCRRRHIRKELCGSYMAGFCPQGPGNTFIHTCMHAYIHTWLISSMCLHVCCLLFYVQHVELYACRVTTVNWPFKSLSLSVCLSVSQSARLTDYWLTLALMHAWLMRSMSAWTSEVRNSSLRFKSWFLFFCLSVFLSVCLTDYWLTNMLMYSFRVYIMSSWTSEVGGSPLSFKSWFVCMYACLTVVLMYSFLVCSMSAWTSKVGAAHRGRRREQELWHGRPCFRTLPRMQWIWT